MVWTYNGRARFNYWLVFHNRFWLLDWHMCIPNWPKFNRDEKNDDSGKKNLPFKLDERQTWCPFFPFRTTCWNLFKIWREILVFACLFLSFSFMNVSSTIKKTEIWTWRKWYIWCVCECKCSVWQTYTRVSDCQVLWPLNAIKTLGTTTHSPQWGRQNLLLRSALWRRQMTSSSQQWL